MESSRSPESIPAAVVDAVVERLPPRLRHVAQQLLSQWPGRILMRSSADLIRIELFDRAMTIAAQFFTSVFPLLIMLAVWLGNQNSDEIADAIDMPQQTQDVLDQALGQDGTAAFGVIGTLVVLISATSLSRALTRAFAVIWDLPRPKSRLVFAWRWLAVVLAMALSLVVVRAMDRFTNRIPPPNFWELVVDAITDTAIAVFVPWVLLAGAVSARRLLPGAVLFALVMMAVRPSSALWMPRALDASAERYGAIGVAFSYITWLYVVAWCFLVAATVGQVIATDKGWFGAWVRGRPLDEVRPPPTGQTSPQPPIS
jgi:membrane protein